MQKRLVVALAALAGASGFGTPGARALSQQQLRHNCGGEPRPPLLERARRHSGVGMSLHPWAAYNVALTEAPLITKALTAGVIIGAGDAAAQSIEARLTGASLDASRCLRWAAFGLLLQGPWNHAFYLLLDGALPPTPDPFTLVTFEKVFIDQFVQAPIFTVIILGYFALVERGVRGGLERFKGQVRDELGDILIKNWSVFLPATVINLAYCPPELRVLFLNCVFFGWVVYLSLFLNADGNDAEEA